MKTRKEPGVFTESIKNRIKGHPFIYDALRFILNPGFRFYVPKRNKFLRFLQDKAPIRVLNIGSGVSKIRGRMIKLDIAPFDGIDVVSDAHKICFKAEQFDAVLLESVLEHVDDPVLVLKESFRLLKPGGFIFVELPFMYEYHQSKSDYSRYTLPGLERLMTHFDKVESGIDVGPTGTFNAVLRNYLGLIFSFGSPMLQELINILLGIVFFPLKLLDLVLVHFKNAQNISSIFYFIGRKR